MLFKLTYVRATFVYQNVMFGMVFSTKYYCFSLHMFFLMLGVWTTKDLHKAPRTVFVFNFFINTYISNIRDIGSMEKLNCLRQHSKYTLFYIDLKKNIITPVNYILPAS